MHPFTRRRVCPLTNWFRGGTHSLGGEGMRGTQFGRGDCQKNHSNFLKDVTIMYRQGPSVFILLKFCISACARRRSVDAGMLFRFYITVSECWTLLGRGWTSNTRIEHRTIPFKFSFFGYFFGGLECVGHSFAYVANFVILRDVWIRTQRAAVACRRATHLATHLS